MINIDESCFRAVAQARFFWLAQAAYDDTGGGVPSQELFFAVQLDAQTAGQDPNIF